MSTTIAEKSNWVDRPNKRANDQHQYRVINQVLPVDKEHKCLVLPADAWTWEYNLASMNPNRTWLFHGLQPDKVDRANLHDKGYKFNQLFHDKYKSKTTFITEKSKTGKGLWLENYVVKTNNKFSLIYADWCGGWFYKCADTTKAIFNRDLLEDESVLILTFQPNETRSEHTSGAFENIRVYYNTEKPKVDLKFKDIQREDHKMAACSVDAIVKLQAANENYALTLAHFGHYLGDVKKHNMFTFTYHVKKNKA